jgi:dTMP kinase
MQRAKARGEGDRMDNEALAFYQRVRAGYLALAKRDSARFAVIDAARSLDDVRAQIDSEMVQFFSKI